MTAGPWYLDEGKTRERRESNKKIGRKIEEEQDEWEGTLFGNAYTVLHVIAV